MTDTMDALPEPPVGHVKVVYMGPVAPHWDFMSDFGDSGVIDQFRVRAEARLLLLPPHDPQFRRNRERINRDAERENLLIDWDLGYDEEEEEEGPTAPVTARNRYDRNKGSAAWTRSQPPATSAPTST